VAKKCPHCGQDNDDSSLRCACGSELGEAAVAPAAAPSPGPASETASATRGRNLVLRKIAFAVWALAFVPLVAALRSLLPVPALHRSLVGTGVFAVSAVAALWFLGREPHRILRVWRIFFVSWAVLLTPLLLTIADGIAKEGWPQGRFNRPIAHLLILVLTITIPAFLTGICAALRTYRWAGALALATGLATLGTSIFLFRATAPIRLSRLGFVDILDLVAIGSKLLTYFVLPIGVALVVGGIMTLEAQWRRRRGQDGTDVPQSESATTS